MYASCVVTVWPVLRESRKQLIREKGMQIVLQILVLVPVVWIANIAFRLASLLILPSPEP